MSETQDGNTYRQSSENIQKGKTLIKLDKTVLFQYTRTSIKSKLKISIKTKFLIILKVSAI